MASQKANRPDRRPHGPGGATPSRPPAEATRSQRPAEATRSPRPDEPECPGESERPAGVDWADEAAQARTSSDPRRVAPHDPAGVPSTGDRP